MSSVVNTKGDINDGTSSSGALAVEDKAFHGGQDWMTTENLIADFSVTTGIMGPCEEALSFLDGNLHKIHHYPALDQEPYRSELKSWLGLPVSFSIFTNTSRFGSFPFVLPQLRDAHYLHPPPPPPKRKSRIFTYWFIMW